MNSALLFTCPQISHLKSVGLGFPTYKTDTIIPTLLPSLAILKTTWIYTLESNNKNCRKIWELNSWHFSVIVWQMTLSQAFCVMTQVMIFHGSRDTPGLFLFIFKSKDVLHFWKYPQPSFVVPTRQTSTNGSSHRAMVLTCVSLRLQ